VKQKEIFLKEIFLHTINFEIIDYNLIIYYINVDVFFKRYSSNWLCL